MHFTFQFIVIYCSSWKTWQMSPDSIAKEMERARDLLSCPTLRPNHKTTASQLPLQLAKGFLLKMQFTAGKIARSLFGCRATAALFKIDILASIHEKKSPPPLQTRFISCQKKKKKSPKASPWKKPMLFTERVPIFYFKFGNICETPTSTYISSPYL